MTNFYKPENNNKPGLLNKILFLFLCCIGIFGSVNAQVEVSGTTPVSGPTPYATLKLAFDAVNAGAHKGVVSIVIKSNTTETATAILNGSSLPSSYTSVSITPDAVGRIVTGNLATGIVKLNGADNVTINGDVAGARGLTFSNTNTANTSCVIWVASASVSDGATNNNIQNCIVTGNTATTTSAVIGQSSGITFGSVAETANSNNSYTGNLITTGFYGIRVAGPTAAPDVNTVISGNTFSTHGHGGIYMSNQQNLLVSKNTISAVASTTGSFTFQTSGIIVLGTITGGLIEKNNISNIRIASVWGCNGIQLDATNTNTNLVIANNFIYDIASGGYSGYNTIDDNAMGIGVNKGGGYKIHFNSIDLSTNFLTSANNQSAAIWIASGITAGTLVITNNIFANRLTTGTRYAIYSNSSSSSIFALINNNDYFSTGSVGYLGSIQTNLGNWQAATEQDDLSVSVNPFYTSTANLHLLGNSPLDALAVPVAGITTDIDDVTRNATTPDIGADEFTPPNCTNPVIDNFPASASVTDICASGSAILTASGYSFGVGISYAWEYSTVSATGPWLPLGQTNPLTASTGTITATRYYHLKVQCNGLTAGYSVPITITVNNPSVVVGPNVPRCGIGTVDLTATGTNLKWYATPTGGSVLGTGSPFTTPVISASTNFYVSASTGSVSGTGGKLAPTGGTGYNGTTGLVFDATQPFRIDSVKMYPQASGQVTIQAVTSGGALIPGCTYVANFAGAAPSGVFVPLNFQIPIGTAHRLVVSNNASSIIIWRDFSGNAYPYILGTVGSITSGYISGISQTYYYFFDWHFSTGCESTRLPITAIVNAPPVFTSVSPAAGAPRVICSGSSVTLNSAGGGYTNYTWNPGALPNGSVVSPTTTTSYTLTADIPPNGCRRDSIVTITVNSTPTPLTITPANVSICPNLCYTVTTSGGLIPGQSVFSENAETFPLTTFTLTGSAVTLNQNSNYYQQGTKSIHLTHGVSANGAIETGNIPLTGFTNPSLTFYQIAGLDASSVQHRDVGYVEFSTDGGAVWTKFPASSYAGSGALYNQYQDATPPGIGFDNTSYPDWDAQFTGTGSNAGITPATNLWKLETINLTAYQGFANFKIRFRILANASTSYFGWLIDNIRLTATGQAPVTWNSNANLFTTCAHTSNILVNAGNFPAPIYWTGVNAAPVTYTATATGGVGCTTSATVTISATGVTPSVSIAANPSGPICAGTPVTFTATPINGGAGAAYNWRVNGGTVSGGSQVGMTTITLSNLLNGQVVDCIMSVVPNFCFPGGTTVTSNPIPMTVNPNPTANNITGGTGNTVCTGAPNLLTETAVGTITNYQWLESDINPVGGNSSTYSATGPGSYTVEVTSNQGCKDTSAPFVITQPTYTITATAGPNGTVNPIGAVIVDCGDDATFTIIPNAGYSITDVLIDGVTNPTAIATGTYTFPNVLANGHTIHATFGITGCGSPATSYAGPNATICSGVNFTLSALRSIGGSGITSGTWTTSGTGTFNLNNTFADATSYTPSSDDIDNGTVNLTLTTNTPALPCLPSSSTMTLTIKRSPYVVITGQIGLCTVGATTTWLVADTSATITNVTGMQWYHPFPTTIGGATNDSLNVTATGSYTVVVNAANGCTGSNTVSVGILPTPTISIAGTGPICTDAGVDINATASTASGTINPTGFTWYNPGVITGANVSILTATAAGTYSATATNSYGCISAMSGSVTLALDNSPLIGDYTIGVGPASCTNYLSFATAINDLNTRSISGDVRFSVPGGYTETLNSPGLILGGTLIAGIPQLNNATNGGFTISFFKSGAGANPLLTAYTGGTATPSSAIPDGMFKLRGVNNVSITEIDLTENAANSGNSLMEFGYGIFKYTTADGAQNNLIQSCTITLNRANSAAGSAAVPMSDGATGIVVLNTIDNNATAAQVPTGAAGTNSNNKFYGNTITNCHNGIWLAGYGAPSPFTLGDTGNDIGGTSAATGNFITNYGNSSDLTAPNGMRINNQWNINASYNTIDNNDGGGVNTTNSLNGIVGLASTSASATISNNIISLKSGATGGQSVTGIDNSIGSTPAGNTITITGNTITGSALNVVSAPWTGIRNNNTAATVTISGNTIQNITLPGTGALTGISNTLAVAVLNVNNNNITGNAKTGTGILNALTLGGPTTTNIISNVISDNSIAGGGVNCTLTCIVSAGGAGATYTLDGNTIYNNSITNMTGAAVGTIVGYNNVSGPTTEILTDNVVRKLFVTGAAGSTGLHSIRGFSNITSGASVRSYLRNSIDSLYTNGAASGAIIGIWSQTGNNVSIGNNKIHSLFPGQGSGLATAKGINVQAGTTVKVYNNMISLDLTQAFAPASNNVLTGATSVSGIEVNGGTTINVYYNTVRLAGGGGAGFGSSAIYMANITPTIDIRNNIFTNFMTPGAGGIVTALRRITASMAGYASTSNNNLWYTTGTASTPLYYAAAGFTTLATFKANVTPRESASIDDNPVFANTAQNDLHLAPNNCNLDGAGVAIAGYTDDFDAELRDASLPDIGMDEFNGTGSGFTWKGFNTDWLNPANWCGGVPTATDDVVIPGGKTFYPVIISAAGLAVARNIDINVGGNITVSNGGVLSNTGSWTNNGILTNNGMIILNGTVNQSFPGGGTGTLPAMDSLVVDNAGGATFNKAFTLTGMLKPKVGNIAVNDIVTLHSDMSGTARVDTVMSSFSYGAAGKFIVERYISTFEAGVPHTGWRFLSIPTNTTETINQAWMEGQTPGTYLGTGYGTIIVGPGGTGVGFDQATTTPSMKTYAPLTNTWVSVPGTNIPIATTEGYMTFLRGDRAASTFGSANSTTLRTRGPIRTGNVIVSTANANVNKFISVGNPYPSAISFSSVSTIKTGLQNTYYVWDPKLSTYGAYQTFSGPSFTAVPGGGSYGAAGQNAIESGQAFFVVANGAVTPHSITITENSKVSSNYQVARIAGAAKQFSTRMYLVSGSQLSLYDGNRMDFDPIYSNVIDDEDALKMSNFGENIGILRDGRTLSIERRGEIVETDTIFYQFGQLRQQEYQLEFTPENLASPILTAYLEDAYLHSSTIIDLHVVSTVNFTVNADAGSRASDRFRIVFRQLGPVPLSFLTVTANRQDKDVLVGWKVANELNIAQYEIEHSADGRNFSKTGSAGARGNGNGSTLQYNWLDVHPFSGDNFYRIRSIGTGNEIKYSEIVKINMAADAASMAVYPNPVRDGLIGLTLNNQPAGDYVVKLFGTNGQLILKQLVIHGGGSQRIMIPTALILAKGIYNLQVNKPGGKQQTIEVNIE